MQCEQWNYPIAVYMTLQACVFNIGRSFRHYFSNVTTVIPPDFSPRCCSTNDFVLFLSIRKYSNDLSNVYVILNRSNTNIAGYITPTFDSLSNHKLIVVELINMHLFREGLRIFFTRNR